MQVSLAFLVLAVSCASVAAIQSNFTLYKIDNAESRDAVCNDGTPAGYYFRQGYGSGQNIWHFHLMGGFWCWDESSCNERARIAPYYLSLNGYPEQWPGPVGAFANNQSTNSILYNANQVYVPYCSSDGWSGDVSKAESLIFNFRGRKIVKAVFEDVYQSRGLHQSGNDRRILFSGCSAGGVGVVVNANFVQQLLRDLFGQQDLRVLNLADAGSMFDYPLYSDHALLDHVFNTTIVSAVEMFQKGFALWKGQIDPTCAAAYPNKPESCYFFQYAYPFIATPVLANQQQYDAWQLDWNIGYIPSQYNSSMESYASNFRLNTVEVLSLATKKQHTIFSGMCFSHCSTESDSWWRIRLSDDSDRSLSSVFESWWLGNATAAPKFYYDHCGSFNCSMGCPPPEF